MSSDVSRFVEQLKDVESRWNKAWEKDRVHEVDRVDDKPKVFCTVPYPYCSGPAHLGTAYTISKVDTYVRFKRMQGFNALLPYAFHWTGVTIAGISERIKRGDEKTIRILHEMDKVPMETVERFKDPVFLARYYMGRIRSALVELGLHADWRREFFTSSNNEAYSKFISWQYLKLRERGYIRRGEHPVVWCPRCRSATGDHDRLEGEGVGPEKFTLVKFTTADNRKLVAATFRPETVYGVTNVWVNPNATYVELDVDGEVWVVSERTEEKLRDQKFHTRLLRKLSGKELLGLEVKAPMSGFVVPVLPAEFVDPMLGTGVVYSVPEHAPYDYVALMELKRAPQKLVEYGLDPKLLEGIEPISIIRTERFGEKPTKYVDSLGITSQTDPRLEEATSEVYREEFMKGIMRENTGPFAGMPVRDAKELMASRLIESKDGAELLDLPSPVVCRCGTRNHVKILPDQYLLAYSDPSWKELAKRALSRMRILPEEARPLFESYIDWYKDWAFVRTFGLGTRLPWDSSFMIETLSDSTVYNAYYIVAKYVNDGRLKPEQMTEGFFDYVMLGRGSALDVARDTGLSPELLEEIRKDFDYWYPVDLRVSGKDLIANHLTFYIFHHVAIFPEEKWPRGISVNGFLKIEGQPMHKSKGVFISLDDALRDYGADVTKLTCLLLADGLDDPDWRAERAVDSVKAVQALFDTFDHKPEGSRVELGHPERWLLSRLSGHVKSVTSSIEEMMLRRAASEVVFDMRNDLRWYARRVEEPNSDVVKRFFDAWVRMLAPFVPHVAEELWHRMGNETYVVQASWPSAAGKVDSRAEGAEEYLKSLVDDVRDVMSILPLKPSKLHIYTCSEWKREAVKFVLEAGAERGDYSRLLRPAIEHISSTRREVRKEVVAKFLNMAARRIGEMPAWAKELIALEPAFDELSFLEECRSFLERELGLEVRIYSEDSVNKYDPRGRATAAEPLRPAIYLE
jgi:leucyl-tRNA synthetase